MARARTLALLRAEVRARADIENDPHVTDAEVDRFINQSAAALHEMIVLACEDDFTGTQVIPTIAGVATYEFDASFYKLISVELTVNGYTRQIDKWTWAQRALFLNVATWGLASQPISYKIVGRDNIMFAPVPDGVYSVRVWYVPASVDMTDPADTYDGRDGWEEWVVLDAAIKAKTKAEEDVRTLQAEREQVYGRIAKAFGTKDQARPDSVVSTVSSGNDPYGIVPAWVR